MTVVTPHSRISSVVQPNISSLYSTWVEINPHAFAHNINAYKNLCQGALFAPVVKSNAYGHGIEIISRLCDELEAVNYICVVSLQEALQLRAVGITKPILVLSIVDGDLDQAVRQDIRLVVFDLGLASDLNRIGAQLGKKAMVHVKVDTGLSRLGVLSAHAAGFVKKLWSMSNLEVEGIFTHLADSENEDQTFVQCQLQRLDNVILDLTASGINIPLHHATCSAAATMSTRSRGNFVRAGVGIYGLWPSDDVQQFSAANYPAFSLQPVMTWKTKIMQIKEIAAGESVGYDRTFIAQQTTRVATLPIGYWDGFDRAFSNCGVVVINRNQARVLGRVAMNLTMIDVTHLDVAVGDEVILLGNLEGVTVQDLANRVGTINYEIVTRINPLIPRVIHTGS